MKTHLLLLLTVFASAACAQESFTLVWSSIDGGGGRSPAAAEFTLAGSSIGQFEAGDPGGGPPGEFEFTGGIWSFEYEPPLDLNLTMQLDGTTVTLTWEATEPPVILESSADLQLWAPVDPQPATPFFQEPEGTRKFYRLVPGP